VSELRLTRDLVAAGTTQEELARHRRSGSLTRLRRGAYVLDAERQPDELHRLMIKSSVALGLGESVISFASAAVLHGLPVPWSALRKVHLTRNRPDSGRIRSLVHVHVAPLRSDEVCMIDGLPVTTLARTVVDLAPAMRRCAPGWTPTNSPNRWNARGGVTDHRGHGLPPAC
jgi:predicted transcriptional regulator of viral defense system